MMILNRSDLEIQTKAKLKKNRKTFRSNIFYGTLLVVQVYAAIVFTFTL